jgi:MraZ protein
MFYGEYSHGVDGKGRLILPAKFRQVAKMKKIKKFYITRGMEECLFLFPENEWKKQEEKFRALPITKFDARSFNRIYFSGATEVVPDLQGRILLPPYLREYAKLKKDVVIIGVSTRIEIWSKQEWAKFYKKSLENFGDIAEKLLE